MVNQAGAVWITEMTNDNSFIRNFITNHSTRLAILTIWICLLQIHILHLL